MKITRNFIVMAVAEAVVLVVYILAQLAEVDFGSAATAVKVVVMGAAAVVAVLAYQAWSHQNSLHTICAMLLGLLGGASLFSSVTTAKGNEIYGSAPMALVGTAAVVAAVAVTLVAMSREGQEAR